MGTTIVHPGPVAAVTRDVIACAGVTKRQLPAAAPAADQASEQRIAMLGRAVILAGWNVAGDHGADRFEPLPAHVKPSAAAPGRTIPAFASA